MSENNPSSNGIQPNEANFHMLAEVVDVLDTIRVNSQRIEIQRIEVTHFNNNTPDNGDQNNMRRYGQVSSSSVVFKNDGQLDAIMPVLSRFRVENDAHGQQASPSHIVSLDGGSNANQKDAVKQSDAKGNANQDNAVGDSDVNNDHEDAESIDKDDDMSIDKDDDKSIDKDDDKSTDKDDDKSIDNDDDKSIDNDDDKSIDKDDDKSIDKDDDKSTDKDDDKSVDNDDDKSIDSDDHESIDKDDDESIDQDDAESIDLDDAKNKLGRKGNANRDDAKDQSDVESSDDQDDAESSTDQDEARSVMDQDVAGSDESTQLMGSKNDAKNYIGQSSRYQFKLEGKSSNTHKTRDHHHQIQPFPTQERRMTAEERWKFLYEMRVRENAELHKKLTKTRANLMNQKAIVNQLVDICSRYDVVNDASNQEIESLTLGARKSRQELDKLRERNLTLANDAQQYKTLLKDLQTTHQICKERNRDDVTSFYENLLQSTESRNSRDMTRLNGQISTLNADIETKDAELKKSRQSVQQLQSQLQAKSDNEQLLNAQLRANGTQIQELKTANTQFAKLTTAFIKDFKNLLGIFMNKESHNVSAVAQLQRTAPAAFQNLIQYVQDTCNGGDLDLNALAALFVNAEK